MEKMRESGLTERKSLWLHRAGRLTLRSHAKPRQTDSEQQTNRIGRETAFDRAIWLALILSVFIIYSRVVQFDFISTDDNLYVYDNPHVLSGLTPGSVKWAFTAVVAANWMPITVLSHMLDVEMFGLQSGMHHLVNVLLHAMSAVLLFVVLRRATAARAASAFVAFVFAVHPLHVESVAWISERKDVLSAFFWFLALYAYVRYVERPAVGRYILVLVPFCLGLMSKPMLVTFPFTLLLFDIWPLRRMEWPKVLWEKLPMFALSAGTCVVSLWAQWVSGAVNRVMPLKVRLINALLSYAMYIVQMFWPARLAVLYPYPRKVWLDLGLGAFTFLLGVSALAMWVSRKRPYLAMGWFWYLGTLIPVIGLVQVGMQSHADRYTYIPMVGLAIMLAWGAQDLVRKWPRAKPVVAATAAVSCLAWMALAWEQTAYWRNAEMLLQHAIDVTPENGWAEASLGLYLGKIPGRYPEALEHMEAAVNFWPDYVDGQDILSDSLMENERYGAAIPHLKAALRARPDFPDTHFRLGKALSKIPGRTPEAIAQYQAGLRLSPDREDAHRSLGELFVSLGRTDEAISHYEAAQRLHPDPETLKIIDRLRAGKK